MNETGIAWTDLTWNPVSGCDKVSEGCKFCYAEALSEQKRGTSAFPNGFELTYRHHKLDEPLSMEHGSFVFVNSMSDFFWDKITDEYRDKMMLRIRKTPWNQYQVLTKRPEKMLEYSRRTPFPDNFWAGVTIENQRAADRLDVLRQVKASVRFVSAEPLLGPLDLDLTDIHWLIAGGESGAQISSSTIGKNRAIVERRDDKWLPKDAELEWVRSLRDACVENGTKFFFKQWGGPQPGSGGRILDGRTWEEFPRERRSTLHSS